MIAYMAKDSHAGNVRASTSLAKSGAKPAAPGMREALAVWALVLMNVVLIAVTYARLPPEDLHQPGLARRSRRRRGRRARVVQARAAALVGRRLSRGLGAGRGCGGRLATPAPAA